ncbi:MAG TPA: polysaccharide deacetylase family protein [Acidimicrobiia bacterium]
MGNPLAPLSLDLDNKWSYLKTHGNPVWESFPSYIETVVPRALDTLDGLGITCTFFIVGKDAEDPANHEPMAEIARRGHEIGNHSYMHEPWLHLYDRDQIRTDFSRAHDAIARATGSEPIGFRGPGYSLSRTALEELHSMGYRYDATLFPNLLNPVGRLYYFMKSNLSPEERRQRKALFGTIRDAFRPNAPFRWDLAEEGLLEIPVTTMPGFRIPFHFSYLIYLARYSPALARAYFRTCLFLCRARGVAPSLLLHPLDFLGVEDEPELGFFPGMDMPRARKLELTREFLEIIAAWYRPTTLSDYAESLEPRRLQPLSTLAG